MSRSVWTYVIFSDAKKTALTAYRTGGADGVAREEDLNFQLNRVQITLLEQT